MRPSLVPDGTAFSFLILSAIMIPEPEMMPIEFEKQLDSHNFLHRISHSYLFISLKPSFLQTSSRSASSRPQRSTAWLDGVRGIAAFLVFIYHFQHMFHNAYWYGYGSNSGIDDYWLIQLPIIRLIANGQTQVSTFYVLSGISLSLRPLELARSHVWDVCFDNLFSSVFRRALRLYRLAFCSPRYWASSIMPTPSGIIGHLVAPTR
jgi:hypothetical protein